MLVLGFPAGPLQANCYVVARGDGQPCVIVDPGQDAVGPLEEKLAEHRLTPDAVLLTHGHFDHVFSAVDVSRKYEVPVWIHPADRYMLADPGAALGPQGRELFGGLSLSEPPDVRELSDDQELSAADLGIRVIHTPGHTGGAVFFAATTEEGGEVLFTGDTLFAGSIGRTDLPGGDHKKMLHTLATKVLSRDDDTVVLPGHGPTTTIGRERASNPFLDGLAGADADPGL